MTRGGNGGRSVQVASSCFSGARARQPPPPAPTCHSQRGFCVLTPASKYSRIVLLQHCPLQLLVSSVRSSSGYHGLIEIRSAAAAAAQATFSNFSNSSDSKVKVKVKGPNMCYIFEKHWIQGYRI